MSRYRYKIRRRWLNKDGSGHVIANRSGLTIGDCSRTVELSFYIDGWRDAKTVHQDHAQMVKKLGVLFAALVDMRHNLDVHRDQELARVKKRLVKEAKEKAKEGRKPIYVDFFSPT